MEDFRAYLQTLTDDHVTIADAEESMDNLINLYLTLADIEKAHSPELEALKNAQKQSINPQEMQQNTCKNQENTKEIPRETQGNFKEKPRKSQGRPKKGPRTHPRASRGQDQAIKKSYPVKGERKNHRHMKITKLNIIFSLS